MYPLFRVAVLLLCISGSAFAQSESRGDARLTPPRDDGQVVVQSSFHLLGISEIQDEAEKVAFTGILTLQWHDPRLSFDPAETGVKEKVFTGAHQFNELATVWHPQVTLANSAGQYDVGAITFRVQPDGTSTLSQAVDAVARVNLNMRRFPFDGQQLEIILVPVGFSGNQYVFQPSSTRNSEIEILVQVPQWSVEEVSTSTRSLDTVIGDRSGTNSALVVTLKVQRHPLFMIRLVVFPLGLIVVLSWSVFWMDRSSLGDRMSVSFVGILTAVAYQIMLVGIVPNVSYVTLMNGFLNLSFLLMCATVVVNLVVGASDKNGQLQRGDLIDRRCRWIFPLVYFILNVILLAVAFLAF